MGDFDKSKFKVISTPTDATNVSESKFDASKFKPTSVPIYSQSEMDNLNAEVDAKNNEIKLQNDEIKKQNTSLRLENASNIINTIPNISEYQKNHIKDLTQKGATPEQLSGLIQGFQKQNEKDIHVWSDKPRASYLNYITNAVAVGSDMAGAAATAFPAMLNDVISMPFNYVASGRLAEDLQPLPNVPESMRDEIGLNDNPFTSKGIAEYTGLDKVKLPDAISNEFYNKDIKARQEEMLTRYDKSIEEYISEGDYSKALGAISGGVAQSLPMSASMMMGNAAGLTGMASTALGAIGFAGLKKKELDDSAPHMSEQDKMKNALLSGSLEMLIEKWGITKLGGITKNILLREGKEEAKKIALDGFKKIYLPVVTKIVGPTAAEEIIGEGATQVLQNVTDKYIGDKPARPDMDLSEGVVDAMSTAAGSALGFSALPAMAEVKANKRANKYAEIIQQEDRVAKENTKSEHAFHVSQQGEETVKAFESNVDNAVANGNLTLEEGEKAKHRVNAYHQYGVETQDLKLDDGVKRKIYDLSYQKQGLQTEVPADIVEKDLSPIELGKRNAKQKQIKDLQKDIDALILSGNEEVVVASKTEADIKKNEEQALETAKSKILKEKSVTYESEGIKHLPKEVVEDIIKKGGMPKLEEVSPNQMNAPKYNHRDKFKQFVEKFTRKGQPRIGKGNLRVIETLVPKLDKQGKQVKKGNKIEFVKGNVIEVELESGHRIRMSSSMIKGGNYMSHFKEENLPKNANDKRAYELMENFPVGIRVVKTTQGYSGEDSAIKIFNAKTGKTLGWAKATTHGDNPLTFDVISKSERDAKKKGITQAEYEGEETRQDELADLETAIETIDPPPPIDKTEPPVNPTNTPTNEVKTDAQINREAKKAEKEAEKNQAERKAFDDQIKDVTPVVIKIGKIEKDAASASGKDNAAIEKNVEDANKLLSLPIRDLFESLRGMGIFNLGDTSVWRPDLGMSKDEFETTLKQIENNKYSKTVEKVFNYVAKIKETGDVPMIGLTGGKSMRSAFPLRTMLSEGAPNERGLTAEEEQEFLDKEQARKESEDKGLFHKIKQTIYDKAKSIINGESIFKRLSPKEERGRVEGGKRNVEASIILSEIQSASEKSKGQGKELLKDKEESALEDYAKENNIWHENTTEEFGEPDANGFEQDVHFNGKTVTKINNGLTQENWMELLDRVSIHNSLFPSTAYSVKGFGKDADGNFVVILEQPTIIGAEAKFADVKKELSKMGFEPINENDVDGNRADVVFRNNKNGTIITDVHGENVLLGEDGELHFIDPLVSADTKEAGYGGKRVLGNGVESLQKQKATKGNIDAEHHERILKITKHIQKVLPKVKVVYNRKLMAAGRLKGNVLEINPYYATEDTPIHEAAHVMLDAIGHDNKVIQAALKQIKASPKGQKMWEAIQNDEHYSKLSVEGQENELLAEAIGLEGKGIFDTEIEKSRFKTFLDYIFDWFKRKLGLEKNIAKSLARQIIGGRGMKGLTGISSKTKEQIVGESAKISEDVANDLLMAKQMEAEGKSPKEIRLSTLWERGADKKWRYEIADDGKFKNIDNIVNVILSLNPGKLTSTPATLGQIFSFNELYKLYPQLKDIKVTFLNKPNSNYVAAYNEKGKEIIINTAFIREGSSINDTDNDGRRVEKIRQFRERTKDLLRLRGVVGHELAHIIQEIEGFAAGADTTNKNYKSAAGEVEARNVQKRYKFTPEQRRELLLSETEDVDRASQVILFGGDESALDKLQKPKKPFARTDDDEVQKFAEFRVDQWDRDIDKENEDIEYANEVIKDKNSTEGELKEAKGLKENILNRIREDKKHYLEYKNTVQTTEDLLKEDTLEDFTKEELIEAYWNASYHMDNNSPLFKAAQTRIAIALENEQIKELQKTNPNFEKGIDEDISPIFNLFKALSDSPGKYPSLQSLSLVLDNAFLAKRQEAQELKSKHEKLAKAVIAEKNKKLGIVKGFGAGLFSSNSAKYFDYVDNGKGQVLTKEEAEDRNLSKAQTEYLDFFRELNDKRNAAYDENDNLIANDIIKIDPKFREQWKQGGFISALNAYLTGSTDLETEIETTDPQTKQKLKRAYGEVQQELAKGKGSLPGKIIKAYGIAFKARKAAGIDIKKSSINYRGALTLKSDKPRPKDRGYSKDFYAAANSLIDNYTHVKHMSPLIPLFDSVQQLYKQRLGTESEIVDFIESELQDKIYQNQGVGKLGVGADSIAKFFRNLGSLTTMAFNIPANIVNIGIGNYSNLRKEGLVPFLKGNGRMFIGGRGIKKSGELAISKKALDILEMFSVVHPDFDSNPQMKLGGAFNKLAYFFNQIGEYQISGSMFLGHMTKEEYNSFELKDGRYQLKSSVDKKAFDKKMQSYKDKVSGIQGKYDEKDRRRFMRTELGKAVAQYKTWMPDWIKSRFGQEFINKYGETEIGSVRSGLKVVGKKMTFKTLTKEGINELMSDVSKGLEIDKKNGRLKNREFAANLNGAIAVAAIYLAINSGDDDKEKKRKKYHETLSLEGAMGNLMFIYDPEQLIYLIEHPVAIQGTIVNFIKALDSAIHGETRQAKKLLIKSAPYGKAYTTYDKYLSSDNK